MGRLGIFLLGAAAGVVGTGLAAWLHGEYCVSSSSSSSSNDANEEAASLRSQREELDEKIEAAQAQRNELEEEIENLKAQCEEVEREFNTASTARAASGETLEDDQADFDEAHAGATA